MEQLPRQTDRISHLRYFSLFPTQFEMDFTSRHTRTLDMLISCPRCSMMKPWSLTSVSMRPVKGWELFGRFYVRLKHAKFTPFDGNQHWFFTIWTSAWMDVANFYDLHYLNSNSLHNFDCSCFIYPAQYFSYLLSFSSWHRDAPISENHPCTAFFPLMKDALLGHSHYFQWFMRNHI